MNTGDDDDDDDEIVREERAIYIVLALVGTPIAIAVLAEGGVFDTGPTISLAFMVLAVAGLLHRMRRQARIPRAEARPATRPRRVRRRDYGSRRSDVCESTRSSTTKAAASAAKTPSSC